MRRKSRPSARRTRLSQPSGPVLFVAPVLALIILFIAASPTFSQGAADVNDPPDTVTNAPTQVSIAGAEATLDARVWRNLMPGPGSGTRPLRLLAILHLQGAAPSPEVSIDALWLIAAGEQPIPAADFSSSSSGEGARATAAAPYSGPSKSFTLVARLRAPDGSTALLASSELRLQQAR